MGLFEEIGGNIQENENEKEKENERDKSKKIKKSTLRAFASRAKN